MQSQKVRWMVAAVVLAVGTILSACSSGGSHALVGSHTSERPGHVTHECERFDGVKWWSLRAGAGQTLVLDYGAELQEGQLSLSVRDADGDVLFEETLKDGDAATARVDLPSRGRYRLEMRAHEAHGSYLLDWGVVE